MHEHEEEKTGDRQTFDQHRQQGRIVFRYKHDEVNGQRLEERDQFRPDALQLKADAFSLEWRRTKGGGDNQKSKQTIDARQSINGKKGKVLIDTTKEKRDNCDARLQRPIR